ncbi:MAG: MYG1 family protein, partial [bacterium]|nr:MYG1 family protein [bacterium]
HHQKEGAGVRENSIPYAAFGLVWKKFGEALSGNREAAGRIDRVLVSPLDASDNGVTLAEAVTSLPAEYTLSDMVDVFMPTFEEDVSEIDTAFMEAVLIAKRVILREIARSEAIISSRKEVERAYEEAPDKRLIVFQKDYSWKETLPQFSEPLYVVHPTNRGVWFLMCVRDNPNTFINRKDLPKEWAGLRDAELAAVTGITDAIFCHRNRFMAVARSKDGAIALARLALRANTNNQETSSKQ